MNKILVTGCAGNTGSYLCELLLKDRNNLVIGIDNFFRGNEENLSTFINDENFLFIKGDIRDFCMGPHCGSFSMMKESGCDLINIPSKFEIDQIYKTTGLEIVFYDIDEIYNLAAVVPTKYFYERPDLTYKVNCEAAINLFDLAVESGVKKFLNASSSEIYGHNSVNANEETKSLYDSPEDSVRWSYAHGKILTEYYMNFYKDQIKVVHLRYANCAGRRDLDNNHVLPYIINSLIFGTELVLNKRPDDFSRSYLSMEDAATATLECMEKGITGHAYNIGTQELLTIRQLFEKCCSHLKINPKVVNVKWELDRPGDPVSRILDISRVTKEVGWTPKDNIDQIIDSVIGGIIK